MWQSIKNLFIFPGEEIGAALKRLEEAIHKYALAKAKENGGALIKIDVADLTYEECNVLVNALNSGRLKIHVEIPKNEA